VTENLRLRQVGKKRFELGSILEKALYNIRISEKEAIELFDSLAVFDIGKVANRLRQKKAGDVVTYVVNRNINFTNVCKGSCRFCAFRRGERSREAYLLGIEEIVKKTEEAVFCGATEVCIQGGLNPRVDVDYYFKMLAEIKKRFRVHIHAFSPMEIAHIAEKGGFGIKETLKMLKESGLDSIPGTAAEILSDDVRSEICPEKIGSEEWVQIIKTAHKLGIPTTATLLYGHVETNEHRVKHLSLLRKIQDETGGFTEFVPLSFIPYNTPLFKANKEASGASGIEDLMLYAVSRIFLDNFRNIQSSWVKLGKKLAQAALYFGANDFGGTIMEESISTAAGQKVEIMTKTEIERAIRKANRIPKERTTTYEILPWGCIKQSS